VPRRQTLGSPPMLGAGALVDRKLRFFNNNPFETLPTPRLSLTCQFHGRRILLQ
jgi:hypothetical protein